MTRNIQLRTTLRFSDITFRDYEATSKIFQTNLSPFLTKAAVMASQNKHSFTASGFGGIEETLQRELDAVQAIYFPPQLDGYSSGDSEGKSSDDHRNDNSDTLFEKPTTLTNNSHESLHQNPDTNDSVSEDSDKCVRTFLTASCQCSLGPNERACSTLFTKAMVSEMVSVLRTNVRSTGSAYHWQTRWAYKRKAWYETISFSILCSWSSSLQNDVFVPSLHIQKKTRESESSVKK